MVMTRIGLTSCIQHSKKFYQIYFKKHYLSLLNERSIQDFSTFFFYLSSTADRKRKKNQFVKNAALHPIDCRYNDFKLDLKSGHDFIPQDLDSWNENKRLIAWEIAVNFFKEAIEIYNSNLVRNANTLVVSWQEVQNFQIRH